MMYAQNILEELGRAESTRKYTGEIEQEHKSKR